VTTAPSGPTHPHCPDKHSCCSTLQDIGYNGIAPELGYDANVINKYFDWYFPIAVRLGDWFAHHPGPESHIYTAHSFLVSLYLSCPPNMGLNCPTLERQAEFRQAVSKGYITWTALPFNAQVEMMDSFMLQSAVHLSHYVDEECGLPHKTVMSQVSPSCHFPHLSLYCASLALAVRCSRRQVHMCIYFLGRPCCVACLCVCT
jgi:hypothetical protein